MSDELLKVADAWADEDPAYIPGNIIKRLAARVRELEAGLDNERARSRTLVNAATVAMERAERAEAERDEYRRDAKVWRHIAQEHYSLLRRARDPSEVGYAIEGALDSLHRSYRKNGKYSQVFCSQCGRAFLHHNYHGYSHCEDHEAIDAALAGGKE